MNDTNPSTDYLNRCIKWRDEKIAELEKANAELNRKLQIADQVMGFLDDLENKR